MYFIRKSYFFVIYEYIYYNTFLQEVVPIEKSSYYPVHFRFLFFQKKETISL